MKMNWGYGLMLAFLAFVGLMGFLVYGSIHTNYDLVTKDYYKDELVYQKIIDGTSNANALADKVKLIQNEQFIQLVLPAEMKNSKVEGTVWFYCAADASRDRKFELMIDRNGVQDFQLNVFKRGSYTVKTEWTRDGKNYYNEQGMIIP